jgi:hypothetical protein
LAFGHEIEGSLPMSIMQQSSKAQDRTIGVWFHQIDQGAVKLPRFQRFEAWDRGRIASFLNTIISNLPVGVTLVLEVAGPEKFVSRYIKSAERTTGTVTQNLLDGQQRLTAFWRAVHDNYEGETFFVYLPQFDRGGKGAGSEVEVRCIPRWINKNKLRMPRWADEPAQCFERGLVPISLLRPGDLATDIDSWLSAAAKPLEPSDTDPDALKRYKEYSALKDKIKGEITTLRERVTHFNLPYLSLPADTGKDVALQVFINMNTNSKPLSLYDIIVAEVESVVGTSLHDLQATLNEHCPNAGHYGDLSDLILATSALLQDKTPNARGEIEMDKAMMLKNWPKLERGLDRMANLLASQGVFDEARLPTNAVLPVIAACYELIPETGDFLGKGEMLLRRYLWSSFFTDRYENTAASRAYADFKALKTLLVTQVFSDNDLVTVPVLNRVEFPLADVDALLGTGWPKQVGISARGILAVTTYLGALDFADNKPASYESNQKREYHHIFPDALLKDAGIDSYRALNCALITWKTNRIIGRKDPLEYLRDRVVWAGEESVRERMKSHLLDFDALSKATYQGLDGEQLATRVKPDFEAFLRTRANVVHTAVAALTQGKQFTVGSLDVSLSSRPPAS